MTGDRVFPGLGDGYGIPVAHFGSIDSTNAEARRRAEAGETGPIWLSADVQTAGRGRRGRHWESPTGNLAATLLLVTDLPPSEAAQISLVAGLAACDAAQAFAPGADARVKWPNDVLLDGKKVAGVLVESGRTADGRLWLAVGVGLNLARGPDTADRPTTRIADYAQAPSPAEALRRLSGALAARVALWRQDGFPAVSDAWSRAAFGLGGPCEARLFNETVTGVAEGLDPDGALRLRLASGEIRRISAGDVFFPGA